MSHKTFRLESILTGIQNALHFASSLTDNSEWLFMFNSYRNPHNRDGHFSFSILILLLRTLIPLCRCRLLLRSLPGLSTPELPRRGLLLRALRLADSANASNSILTDISAVAVLRGLVGDALVDPIDDPIRTSFIHTTSIPNCPFNKPNGGLNAYLRFEEFGP